MTQEHTLGLSAVKAPDQPSHGNNRAKGQEQPRKCDMVLWKKSLQQIKIPFDEAGTGHI